jgi:hypothetical protein
MYGVAPAGRSLSFAAAAGIYGDYMASVSVRSVTFPLTPHLAQTKEVHVEKGCTDLPLWSDVDLDLGSARGLVVEELGLLDERGVGKS